MNWKSPTFVELNMSAEIGGYQSDFDGQDPVAPPAPRSEEREVPAGMAGAQPARR